MFGFQCARHPLPPMSRGEWIDLAGVPIPNKKENYQPVLESIAALGIKMVEETSRHR